MSNSILYSYGFVEYASVEEAKVVLDKQEEFVLAENTLFIDYGFHQGMLKEARRNLLWFWCNIT